MENREAQNASVTEFILLGFGELPNLQNVLFLLFFIIYSVTMLGNLLIIVLVVSNRNLHTPMYFFVGNLSCLEILYSSTTQPRMLASLVTGDQTISFTACFVQFYIFGSLVATECFLLSVMSYDRYLAICKPLHYAISMKSRNCFFLVSGAWMCGFLASTITTWLLSQLTFCGPNKIDDFFCDFNPLLKLSCTNTQMMVIFTTFLSSIFTFPPFVLTLMSYVYIILVIMKIPSTTGREKAFSTCSSHLIVVTIFYGTVTMVYVLPDNNSLRDLNKILSTFYTVLTPMVNPLIYSLRNKEVKEALKKCYIKYVYFTKMYK